MEEPKSENFISFKDHKLGRILLEKINEFVRYFGLFEMPENFWDLTQKKMIGDGLQFRGNDFVAHTKLHHKRSAIYTIHPKQSLIVIFSILVIIGGFMFNAHVFLIIIIGALSVFYFLDLLFNLFLITRNINKNPEIEVTSEEIEKLDDVELPIYTIFCPLYKEWQVVGQFVAAISKIDWPKEKLDVQLLLEEDDEKTINELKKKDLPSYFRIIIVPDGHPKTKPKACNYGLNHAKGKFAVIYDAEDIPDPQQLKKAYLILNNEKNKNIICAQAKLNFYNSRQNILAKLFTAEYLLWFDLILPGLQSIKAPIPLGGTSNHFKTKDLEMLKGWDPFNVTEDCDLGIRIASLGYYTAIFNSTTLEEANTRIGNWVRQRSRWIKGYMQTYLVHMRNPKEFRSIPDKRRSLTFQLIVGGKTASILINPAMWALTLVYFSFRQYVGPTIESFYPTPVLYIAFFSLLFGNFLYFYYYMIGCAKRKRWDLMKSIFLVPFYWLLMSIAAWKALYQLFFKPHYWEKTVHGFHFSNTDQINEFC